MSVLDFDTVIDMNWKLTAERISRIGDRSLGRLQFDFDQARSIGQQRIGLFAEGFLEPETMVGRLLPLASVESRSKVLVLYASKESGEAIYRMLEDKGYCKPSHRPPERWEIGTLCFSSIESLTRWDCEAEPISVLILADPTCMVYNARNYPKWNGKVHDRPQLVGEFLDQHAAYGWLPPFMLMTTKRAASVPTDQIARAFMLETWWYLDGPTFRFFHAS